MMTQAFISNDLGSLGGPDRDVRSHAYRRPHLRSG